MASKQHNDDGIINDINMTPMVDIMLVLLIIFMVTASLIVTPSIPVKLPTASTGETTPTETASIVLTKDNKYFIEGKEIVFNDIQSYLETKKNNAKDGKLQVVIAADKQCYYGEIIKIVDVIRIVGIIDYAFNIEEQ